MLNDLRYAGRTLRKAPGFVTVAVATMALGIGANTAIFSVVNGVLLRPLPFRDADRLVRVVTFTANEESGSHSAGDFLDLQQENQSLAAIAGYRQSMFGATARPGEPMLLEGSFVTVDFFEVLGVPPILGRTFSRTTDRAGGEGFVVLSTEAWRQLYSGARQAIGERLRLDGEPHTVLGVMPPRAEWPARARLWVLARKDVPPSPIGEGDEPGNREVRYFEAIARLRDTVTFAQAERDMNRVAAIIQQRRTRTSEQRGIRLMPLHEALVGNIKSGLLVVQAAVALVLLIACANVSGLCLARANGRRQELAVRAALGAGRGRLVRQLLIESLVLGLIGGLCGLTLGAWLIALLAGVLPAGVPRAGEIGLDRVVAVTTLATAIATGVLFGIVPALQASRTTAGAALKQSGERSTGRARTRSALVVAEVALTLVLLAGASLLVNSFLRLQRVDSGLQPDNVTIMSLLVPSSRYPTGAAQTELYRRILEGLSEREGIASAGIGFPGPLRGTDASGTFLVEGRSTVEPGDPPFANIGSVSGGYFSAMGIPIVAGRTFADSDRADAPEVAIVSAALARKHWPGQNAVGRRLRFAGDEPAPWRLVVGVVGDVRQLGLDQEPPPILYIPYQQFPLPFTNIAVRSDAPRETIASLLHAQLAAIDPELPPGNIASLQDVLDRSVAHPRFRTLLISAFAILALALAAVGIFGLISYSVTQRTREIGIRIALGASAGQVLGPMVREGVTLAGLGVAIGIVIALLFARVLSSLLYGVSSTDPLTFAGVAVALLTVAFLAAYLPSRRALQIDPISALRAE